MPFDIESLLDFAPPTFRCPRCLALWVAGTERAPVSQISCPVCELTCYPPAPYLGTDGYPQFLYAGATTEPPGLPIHYGGDPVEHARTLAHYARLLRGPDFPYAPWAVLANVLLNARSFVHFTSHGLSLLMLGMLRTVAQRVPVHGLVSKVDKNERAELEAGRHDAPQLHVHATEPDEENDTPHTKLIVVDGLIAISGSVNFTHTAWRKARKGFEMVDVHTVVDEVVTRNNRYFSALWANVSDFTPSTLMTGWRYALPSSPIAEDIETLDDV